MDKCVGVLIGMIFSFAALVSDAYVIVNDGIGGTGGDCSAIGLWDGVTGTCALTSDVGASIRVDSPGLTIDCADPVTSFKHKLTGPESDGLPAAIFPLPGIAHSIVVRDCEISGYFFGFSARNTSAHRVEDSDVQDNFIGVILVNSTNNVISGNRLRLNTIGILGNNTDGSEFSENSVEDNGLGINLRDSDEVLITSNTFLRNRNDRAAQILNGFENLVADNTFTDNGFGITLIAGGSHEIRDNVFIGNGFARSLPAGVSPTVAISGEGSNDNVLTNNILLGNAYGFGLKGTGNRVDTSNTVEGRPIYWFNDLDGANITPAMAPGAAGVYCDRCTNVTIRGFDLETPMGISIGLFETTGSSVEDNVIRDGSLGVLLSYGSNDNIVLDNDIRLGFEDVFAYGIRLNGADANTIAGNNVDLGPGNSGWKGISVGRQIFFDGMLDPADFNVVANNRITRVLQQAIEVAGSYNSIEGNTITDTGGGIIVGAFGVEENGNIVRENIIRDGRDAWFPFNASPGTFGHGINVEEAVDTLVMRNTITGMRDNGLLLKDSIRTTVTQNNIFRNARTGLDNDGNPIYEITSVAGAAPAAIELSVDDIGNYWGHNCGLGGENGSPLFQAGTDSNDISVVDRHPFPNRVAAVPPGSAALHPMPCPTGNDAP